jgi:hypothetical protein
VEVQGSVGSLRQGSPCRSDAAASYRAPTMQGTLAYICSCRHKYQPSEKRRHDRMHERFTDASWSTEQALVLQMFVWRGRTPTRAARRGNIASFANSPHHVHVRSAKLLLPAPYEVILLGQISDES